VWTVERSGLTVAEAQDEVAVVVVGGNLVHASVRSRNRGGQAGWQTRLAQWVERVADAHLRRPWVPHL